MNLSQIKEAIYSEAINSAAITAICLSVVANQCTGCMIEPQYRTFLSGLEAQTSQTQSTHPSVQSYLGLYPLQRENWKSEKLKQDCSISLPCPTKQTVSFLSCRQE